MTPRPARARRVCATGAIAAAATLILVQPAFALANVEGLLQNVVDMLTGNTARLLAAAQVAAAPDPVATARVAFGAQDLEIQHPAIVAAGPRAPASGVDSQT